MTDQGLRSTRHEPTVARNAKGDLVVACRCGWKASTIFQREAGAQLRHHLSKVAREWTVTDLVLAVREYLPPDIRESHTAGKLGGGSCLAHEALDRLGAMAQGGQEAADNWIRPALAQLGETAKELIHDAE